MLFKREVGNFDEQGGNGTIPITSNNTTRNNIPDISKYTQYSSSVNQVGFGTNNFPKSEVSNENESDYLQNSNN